MAHSTREKILAVSLRLFNEQGYHHVTMRAIADALSISVGNLTYHLQKERYRFHIDGRCVRTDDGDIGYARRIVDAD